MFWQARAKGASVEKAALLTFTGKWAEGKGFNKVRYVGDGLTVTREIVVINFLK